MQTMDSERAQAKDSIAKMKQRVCPEELIKYMVLYLLAAGD